MTSATYLRVFFYSRVKFRVSCTSYTVPLTFCCLVVAEVRQILQEGVQSGRARLADSELIAGKWNKEDKASSSPPALTVSITVYADQQVKVASLCAEKTEWLAQHRDCSVHEATQQTDDFHCRLLPHLNKLQPAS